MITNKHITKLVAVFMAAAVCLCFSAMAYSNELIASAGGRGVSMEYESKLFDTSEPVNVNILMDAAQWETMLANATSEEYYQCDVEVNGKLFRNVAIRPKGNTSLTSIARDPDTDRFSLKLEFDHYVKGQTCFGLDKLVLNNNYADATNMKEALVYDMYRFLGADASLYNYAKISVNDEYWGVYLALEAVEDSFLLRNYGAQSGELYKPESMDMGGLGGGDRGNIPEGFDPAQFGGMMPPAGGVQGAGNGSFGDMPAAPNGVEGRPDVGNFDREGFGGFSMGGKGANLNYTDDELESYSTIWEGEVTKTSQSDHKRVVEALKHITEGTDLETYMDVDNLLRYMAVHVFSVNEDSLSGSMAHNYYLYEYKGQLNILPWDYNLALGGMGKGGSATGMVNDAIDGAFSGTKFFDTLMENEEYKAKYHAYLQQLVDEYINGGGFEAFYTGTRSRIDSLVETDPTFFYPYEEYTKAAEMLYEVVGLRGRSIDGQLKGSIPSTASGQRNSSALIDASHLDLTLMGVMNMGGGGQGGGFNFGRINRNVQGAADQAAGGQDTAPAATGPETGTADTQSAATGTGAAAGTDSAQPGGMMSASFDPAQFGGAPPAGFDGSLPEGFDPSQFGGEPPAGFGTLPEGLGLQRPGGQVSDNAATAEGSVESTEETALPVRDTAGSTDVPVNGDREAASQNSRQGFDPAMMGFGSSRPAADTKRDNLIMYSACFTVLVAALVFAKLFRRRRRMR